MDMLPVESSTIAAIGYDPATAVLAVTFKTGATYHYAGVPPEEFAALGAAPSRGRYLHARIKPVYAATRVAQPQPPPDVVTPPDAQSRS